MKIAEQLPSKSGESGQTSTFGAFFHFLTSHISLDQSKRLLSQPVSFPLAYRARLTYFEIANPVAGTSALPLDEICEKIHSQLSQRP
jgi:hypothetical protein